MDQLPIIFLTAAKFAAVIRFSVENLLNSGCHVPDNLIVSKNISYVNHSLYHNIFMTTGINFSICYEDKPCINKFSCVLVY